MRLKCIGWVILAVFVGAWLSGCSGPKWVKVKSTEYLFMVYTKQKNNPNISWMSRVGDENELLKLIQGLDKDEEIYSIEVDSREKVKWVCVNGDVVK